MTYNTEYNRQGDSPESLIITPLHVLAALVAIIGPLTKKHTHKNNVIHPFRADKQHLCSSF